MSFSRKLAFQEAEKCVSEVLQELNITSLPVLPIEIAKRKNIVVRPFSGKTGMAGCLMMIGNEFGIGYSDHLDNEGFVNFTVGHELGHFHLPGHIEFIFRDGNTTHYSASAFTSSEPHEKQADAFSAALLMPERLFRPVLRKSGIGLVAVKELARLCKTSLTATAIRYGQLTEDPVAVIVSRGEEIEFAVVCPVMREIVGVVALKRGDSIPERSATFRFNRDYENVIRSETVESTCSLSDWFPDAPDQEMNEDIIGLGKYSRTLTILFTEELINTGENEEPGADWRFRSRLR